VLCTFTFTFTWGPVSSPTNYDCITILSTRSCLLKLSLQFLHFVALAIVKARKTRKLCYCKYDRAMRPIYGCSENFRDSLTTPTATFPKMLWGFCNCSDVPPERALVSFYRPSTVTFPPSLRVSEILPLLFSSMLLFPYPTSSLPQSFPIFPWE